MKRWIRLALIVCCLMRPVLLQAQQSDSLLSVQELKKLDLDRLLKLEVTSVSRHEETASRAAAAVEVITQEQMKRVGITTVPDALRLATGVQVSRFSGQSFAISSRGFTSLAANKLLVMQDGRSLYSPLFSGVFWDAYGPMNLDRIEVVRGPGATMWGANAVNGVINIITSKAQDTQGMLVTGGGGTEERAFGGARYGGKLGDQTYYRVYGRYQEHDEMALPDGSDANDASQDGLGGFRLDSKLAGENELTVQGDYFYREFDELAGSAITNRSGNLLARWTHQFAAQSELQFQTYYDRFERDVPGQFGEDRDTYDADAQYRTAIGERHDVIGGVNYRVSADRTKAGGTIQFDPPDRTLHIFSAFIQDEMALAPNRLVLVLGSKFEWHTLGGFEPQPSVRLAWTPTDRHTVWTAVSRAVRMPSRIDEDLRFIPVPASGIVLIEGNPDFEPEVLLAYELGSRIQPHERVFVDVAGYFNDYDRLRSLEPTPPIGIPLKQFNRLDAENWGVEVSLKYQAAAWWRLNANYTYLHKELQPDPDSRDPNRGALEGNDAPNMASLWSSWDLPQRLSFDGIVRYVDALPQPSVPSYVELDLRLGWQPVTAFELAVVGQNLLDEQHREFGPDTPNAAEVQRGVYGRVTWRF
jgi:iron complex outermembrane receptor protein